MAAAIHAVRNRQAVAGDFAGFVVKNLWEKDASMAKDLTRKRARCVEMIEAAEEAWLEAEDAHESAKAEAGV